MVVPELEPVPSSSSTTIKSLDHLHNHLPPSAPPQFLTHHIVTTLLRRGFSGAEAGALAEIERLLEHHISSVFESSGDYARLAGRLRPNAFDLLQAREEVESSSIRKMRNEGRKRRRVMKLETTAAPPSPERAVTLQDLPPPSSVTPNTQMDIDQKPDIFSTESKETGHKPTYGFEGIPSLPPKWTYPAHIAGEVVEDVPHGQITKRSLDFVKLTASERGDIPPELGVVNFKKHKKRAAAA